MNLEKIRPLLERKDADAWILVDYENRNPMTIQFWATRC
jgi:hypothetical protein